MRRVAAAASRTRLFGRVAALTVSLAASLALGEGSSLSLRSELVNELDPRSLIATHAQGGNITAFADKACPEQVGRCKMDNECAQEIGGLIGGAQPISAAAQALVQCVNGNMAQNRLQLRSEQAVESSVEHFGSAPARLLAGTSERDVAYGR